MHPCLFVQSQLSMIYSQQGLGHASSCQNINKISHQSSVTYVVTEMNDHILHYLSCSASFNLCYSVDKSIGMTEHKMSGFVSL